MEELKRQMSESMPGTMPVFAEALQQLRGGDLKGQKAIQFMLEEVSAGNVESAKILPLVAELMGEKAKGGLAEAVRTSQAEQERFQNTIDDLLILAEPKTEESFSRIFRTLSEGLRSAEPLVMGSFTAFEKLTKVFESFGYVSGTVIEGWTNINALMEASTEKALGIKLGLLEVAGASMVAFTKVGRLVGKLLILEDVLMFFRGDGDTVTGRYANWARDMGEKHKWLGHLQSGAGELIGGLGAFFTRDEKKMYEHLKGSGNLLSEDKVSNAKFEQMLKARGAYDPGKAASYINVNPAMKLNAFRQGYDQFGRPLTDPDANTPSPQRVAYWQRMKDINEMELRYERALVSDRDMAPDIADKAGDKWARPMERQALKDFQEGNLNINANVNVTGESTEEATEKFKVSVQGILDDMFMEAYSPFVKQDF